MPRPAVDYVPRPYVRPAYEPDTRTLMDLLRLSGASRANAEAQKGQNRAAGLFTIGKLISDALGGIQDERMQKTVLAQKQAENDRDEKFRRDQLSEQKAGRESDRQWQRDQFRALQADASADMMVPGQSISPEMYDRRFAGTASDARFQHQPAMDARLPARPIADAAGMPGYSSAMSDAVQSPPEIPMDQPWEPMQGPTMSGDVAARPERYTRSATFGETQSLEAAQRAEAAAKSLASDRVEDNRRAAEAAKATEAYRANQLKFQGANLGIASRNAATAEARLKLAQKAAEGSGDLDSKQIGRMIQLSNALKGHPEYVDMIDINTGWQGVQTGLRQNNGFGDITAINAFQRMVDPGATVREGDVALLQSASSFVDKVLSDYPIERLRKGDKLPQAVRDRMIQTAKDLYSTRAGNYNNTVGKQYRSMSEAAKIPFNLIGSEFEIPESPKGPAAGVVIMIAPNGQEQSVSPDQVEHFKSLGAKVKG